MKVWRTVLMMGVLGLGLGGSGLARADALLEMEVCLDHFDLACARQVRDRVSTSDAIATDRAELWLAFHEGRYDDAVAALERLEAVGVRVEDLERGVPYRPTAESARGMVEAVRGAVAVRYSPGPDRILVDEALDVLEGSRLVYDEVFGAGPPQTIVLDIFPTATRFIGASGIPPESVRTTGVIALSKWTRLLLTSPRALGRGYGWKDTVAHEYIHLVVAYNTRNRAPVWLQEGLAKHLETWWRGDRSGHLDAHAQSLLAEAVRSGAFVPFEKFARSMAYLDSGEEAALAFAQVSTMIQFMLETTGPAGLAQLMERVGDGEDAQSVVADLAGFEDFERFRTGWRAWLRSLPLVQEQLASLPVVLDGEGGDFDGDPLLSGRPDLARFARLGDLLRQRGHYEAALIEYDKAADPTQPPSPLLLARRAVCHRALKQPEKAVRLLKQGVELYPEFTPVQKSLGQMLAEQGQNRAALKALLAAHDLNPYDPEVQALLTELFVRVGDEEAARRHRRYGQILATGGVDDGESPVEPG
jgi:tetratricopeptide (TPR) repeat protein